MSNAHSEYQKWMNTVQSKVTISISPSSEKAAELRALCDPNKDYAGFDRLYRDSFTETVHENITLIQAQTLAEPLRIANPDQCVSIYTDGNSFIGNTSWNDQMKMFWEYETYTPEGATIAAARKAECDALGKIASWE